MPQQDINLIPQDVQNQQKAERRFKGFSLFSLIQCGIVCAVVLGMVVYRFVLESQVSRIEREVAREIDSINASIEVLALVNRVQSKQGALGTLVSSRRYYSGLLNAIPSYFPTASAVSTLSVSGDRVEVTGRATNTLEVAKLLKVVVDQTRPDPLFDAVILNSLSVDVGSGKVAYAISLTLKPGVLLKP